LKTLLPSLAPEEAETALQNALKDLESALTAAKLFRAHIVSRLNALRVNCAYDESVHGNYWNVSG
jgi:flagellin-like hook-associated protein FlgL